MAVLPAIDRLGRLAGGAFERAAMLERLHGLHGVMAPLFAHGATHDPDAADAWQRAQAIVAAAQAWLAPASPS